MYFWPKQLNYQKSGDFLKKNSKFGKIFNKNIEFSNRKSPKFRNSVKFHTPKKKKCGNLVRSQFLEYAYHKFSLRIDFVQIYCQIIIIILREQ